jgi:hypothetical protein
MLPLSMVEDKKVKSACLNVLDKRKCFKLIIKGKAKRG